MGSIKNQIKKLEKEYHKDKQIYLDLLKAEGSSKNPDKEKIRDLKNEMYAVVDDVYTPQINVLKTKYYIMLINKYNLYIPFDYGDNKYSENSDYGIYFTNLGFIECKKMIDSEKDRRIKLTGFIISTVTGIIGALIGLLSVIKLL